MRRELLTASMVAVVALIAGIASASEAGLGWPGAEANFVSYDASGCVATQVDVFVRGAAAGGGAAPARLFLALSRVDECRDVQLAHGKRRVPLAPGAFQLAPDLSAATLKSKVVILGKGSGKSLTLDINLAWAAKEDAVTAPVKAVAEGPGEIIRVKSPTMRTMRLANASGTIKSGASNYTPGTATDASLSRTWTGRQR